MHVAVCGMVGSGKSSLLSCILGEMPKLSGEVKACGTMAYVSQLAWIQSGKIQDNILFGKEMDSEKYDKVDVCRQARLSPTAHFNPYYRASPRFYLQAGRLPKCRQRLGKPVNQT
jgi:ABC-type transport system involved in cytochrome bd biosynthesis fused ATPase/permease subunit